MWGGGCKHKAFQFSTLNVDKDSSKSTTQATRRRAILAVVVAVAVAVADAQPCKEEGGTSLAEEVEGGVGEASPASRGGCQRAGDLDKSMEQALNLNRQCSKTNSLRPEGTGCVEKIHTM